MKKYIIAFYLVGMSGGLVSAQDYVSKVWVSDQGDGTYKNPVLYADYSDPDACRVGDDYYLTSSSFGCFTRFANITFQGFGELEYHWCGITLCRTSHKR